MDQSAWLCLDAGRGALGRQWSILRGDARRSSLIGLYNLHGRAERMRGNVPSVPGFHSMPSPYSCIGSNVTADSSGGSSAGLDMVQTLLGGLGMIPEVGTIFNGINTGIDIARGNWGRAALDGGLTLAALVPGAVIAVRGAQALELADEALETAQIGERTINISERGLDLVTSHLAQFGEHAPNTAMLERLQSAYEAGQPVTGADANFYLHEASEATMMKGGMPYDAAHAAAIQKYGVSPYSLYNPDVIRFYPEFFNSNWRAFWGIE